MSEDCGLLIFEVTEGRILPLPIANQQSSLKQLSIPPLGKQNGAIPLGPLSQAPCKNPPWPAIQIPT
jgi:hypothetical protein